LTNQFRSFKALALGADFVQLGHPILWGLAHEGEKGVKHVLKSLLADFEITVGLAGCASLADLDESFLAENS
jgi:lactate 2-monooxygenase